MENKAKTSILKSRRFKYGSMAVGLTVLLIALVIALNAVVYAVTYTNGWYLDLSGQQYFGITDASTADLESVLSDDSTEIQITFCQERDRVLADSAGYYVYKCVESYKRNYSANIKLTFVDIVKHPDVAQEYYNAHTETLTPQTVIVESNKTWENKQTGKEYDNVRVFDYNDFFMFDSDTGNVFAFKGELVLTSSIVALCEGAPICYFTTGNGETISSGDSQYNSELAELMEDAGFVVRAIDLDQTPNLDDAKVVIVNDPKMDFTDNEVQVLERFVDYGGNLMVFLSPEAMVQTEGNKLKNIETFIKTNCGVEIIGGPVVDRTASITADGLSVKADYPLTTIASALHQNLREFVGSVPMTIVNSPLAFKATWQDNGNGGYTGGNKQGTMYWMLHSYTSSSLGKQENKSFDIAALVEKTRLDPVTNSQYRSYTLVTSAGFVKDEYVSSNAYGNRDILFQLAAGVMAKEQVVRDIDPVIFAYEELTITTGQAYMWTVLLVAVIPAIVITAGTTVCFIRRRRG